MAKKIKTGAAHLLLLSEVEQKLAPLLMSDYTAQVLLDLSPRHEAFMTTGLYFFKIARAEKHDTMFAWIRFYPYPSEGDRRFQMEIAYGAPVWTAQADTAEEAVKATDAALKRLVAEERAARRAQRAEWLAEYDRRQAEASA
ncbi:hypothetical protein [Methylobacterium sp. D48H]